MATAVLLTTAQIMQWWHRKIKQVSTKLGEVQFEYRMYKPPTSIKPPQKFA
jgi:hypothetical protein